MRFVIGAFCAVLPFGCTGSSPSDQMDQLSNDVDKLAEDLGSFDVQAKLIGSSCDPDVPAPAEGAGFQVRLAQRGNQLIWKTGLQGYEGTVDTQAGGFTVASETAVQFHDQPDAATQCVLVRKNEASGNLKRDQTQIGGFDGTMSFGFAVPEGIDCSPLEKISKKIDHLPCDMKYALKAIKRRLQ